MRSGWIKALLLRALLLMLIAGVLLLLVMGKTACIFRQLTSVPCPTCGMSRAWLAAFRLDLAGALGYHPMFWGIGVLGLLYLLDGFTFPGKRCTRSVYLLILFGFFVTYIIRLFCFFSGDAVI